MDGFAGQVKAGPLISENYSNRHANVNKIGAEFPVFFHSLTPDRWSGGRDSNPRQPAWKAGVLPLNYPRRIRAALRLDSLAKSTSTPAIIGAGPERGGRSGPSRSGGQGGIRTPEGVSQQIYSLPRLTTSVPGQVRQGGEVIAHDSGERKGVAGERRNGAWRRTMRCERTRSCSVGADGTPWDSAPGVANGRIPWRCDAGVAQQ